MVFGVDVRKIWVKGEKLAQRKFAKPDLKDHTIYLTDHLLQKCTQFNIRLSYMHRWQ